MSFKGKNRTMIDCEALRSQRMLDQSVALPTKGDTGLNSAGGHIFFKFSRVHRPVE